MFEEVVARNGQDSQQVAEAHESDIWVGINKFGEEGDDVLPRWVGWDPKRHDAERVQWQTPY
jgi:hypothetical protein